MGSELAGHDEGSPLTVQSIVAQVKLIQNVMEAVMQGPTKEHPEGVHYGVIPGCKKPTLLKPGAEKLSMTFRLRPIIDNDRDIDILEMPNGHREIRVYCHVMNMAGVELATGVGSCSTMENKYRYRGGEKTPTGQPIPKEYWNLNKINPMKAKQLIGGEGFGVAKVDGQWQICVMGEKGENPDIADTYNTVLKMAKKRAYVDGILSATAASDIFTQDIEDMPNIEQPVDKPAEAAHKPAVNMPQSQSANDKKEKQSEIEFGEPAKESIFTDLAVVRKSKIGTDFQSIIAPCISWATHKVKKKNGTMAPVTEYQVGQDSSVITIAVWGEEAENVVDGCTIEARKVTVNEFRGDQVYSAKEVIVIGAVE